MNWVEVNAFVEEWAAERQIPPSLQGKTFTLVEFENEKDCQFFYPDRTLHAQQVFTSALTRFVRERHGRTVYRKIIPEHYRAWLLGEKIEDSPQARSRFIESRYQALPSAK